MTILPELAFYINSFKNKFDKKNLSLLNIIYNDNIIFGLNNNLINIIENQIENDESFKAFVTELNDNDRIYAISTKKDYNYTEQIFEYYIKSQEEFLIPVKVEKDSDFKIERFKTLIDINSPNKLSKDWIIKELLENKSLIVSHCDFKTNGEIDLFFEEIYHLSKNVKTVNIFNREITGQHLNLFNGKNISYYTLFFGLNKNRNYYIQEFKDLKKVLGGKTKLFFTSDKRILHERKILLGNLIITIDNSLNNLLVQEPTWCIVFNYSKKSALEWMSKVKTFKPFYV